MTDLNYHIINSGSDGNAVVIENILVDAGVSYRRLKDYLYDVDILLLTHAHTDHMRPSTIKKIREEFPNITIVANRTCFIVANTEFDIMVHDFEPVKILGYEILPIPMPHDVECHGYSWYCNGQHIIYATDTNSMENAPRDDKYDYFFIESNYDEKRVEATKRKSKQFKYNVYANHAYRHLSTKRSKEFYLCNRRSKESEWIELHKSKDWY